MAEARQAVLQAAITVFAAEGFYEADVQIIADRAGVGKGTVYRYFGDKEKLFFAAAAHALEQMAQSINQELHPGRGALDFLQDIAIGCARYYEAHPEAVEMIVQERAVFRKSPTPTHLLRRAEGQKKVEDELRHGIECGELRVVDVHATYETFGDLLFGCIFNGVIAGKPKSLVARVQRAVTIFIEGIRADAAAAGPRPKSSNRIAKGGSQ